MRRGLMEWVVMWLAVAVAVVVVVVAGEGDMILSSEQRHHLKRSIVFPGETFTETRPPIPSVDGALELPEDLNLDTLDLGSLSLINNIDNITDFAHLFGIELPATDDLDIHTRFGGVAEKAVMANCKPELRTVELDLPVEANTLFYPTCVRLEQCGGCCYGPLLTCRPKLTKAVTLQVLKTKVSVNGGNRRRGRRERRNNRRRRRETVNSYHEVEVLRHVECECGCKVTEQDCKPTLHTYVEGECACVCNNKAEKAACEAESHTKYWDNDSCSCYCRRPLPCSSGQEFSPVTCRCE